LYFSVEAFFSKRLRIANLAEAASQQNNNEDANTASVASPPIRANKSINENLLKPLKPIFKEEAWETATPKLSLWRQSSKGGAN